MINRTDFIQHLEQYISDRIQTLQIEIEQLRLDISSDSKSTAGDKHETSRAMAQLEMEKLGSQIVDYQKFMQTIKQLSEVNNSQNKSITIGSLIELSNGWYFLGVGIGKILFKDSSIFCLSTQSPLGQQLINKSIGDEIKLPALNLKIIKIENQSL